MGDVSILAIKNTVPDQRRSVTSVPNNWEYIKRRVSYNIS